MPRKVISIITPYFSPEVNSAAQRIEGLAKLLSSAYKVHVFTLIDSGNKLSNEIIKCDENLSIHYIKAPGYFRSGFIGRNLLERWYSLKLVRNSNTIDSDLTIVSIPFKYLLQDVLRHSNAKRKIVDIRDLSWCNVSSSGFIKNFFRKKKSGQLHKTIDGFDAVTVTNEIEKKWLLINAAIPDSEISIVPNGICKEKFTRLINVKYSSLEQYFTISYIGDLNSSQHFLTLINAVKDLKDVRLNLVGDGKSLQYLKQYVSSKKILNVSLPGKLNWHRAVPYYQTADILFGSLNDNIDTSMPANLYEYLSTGLPVLFQGSGLTDDFLRNFKNTFVFAGTDSKSLEKLILRIKRLAPERSDKNIKIIEKNFISEKLNKRFGELCARYLNDHDLSNISIEDILQGTEH